MNRTSLVIGSALVWTICGVSTGLAFPRPAYCQIQGIQSKVAPGQPPPKPELKPTILVVTPSKAPKPALKYSLVPSRQELVAGNAAIFYHRAIQMLIERRSAKLIEEAKLLEDQKKPAPAAGQPKRESQDVKIHNWLSKPLSELPLDDVRKVVSESANVLNEIELGALRKSCDWEFDSRKEGYYLLLPEIQEMRSLGRLVSLRARLAIAEKKFDEAMHWIQVGMAMGRHVGDGSFLIQTLVGLAMSQIMLVDVEEFIQQKGAPNLYWALATRPRPFVNQSFAFDNERFMLERELPDLRELDGEPWSTEHARRFLDEMQTKLAALTESPVLGKPGGGSGGKPSLNAFQARLVMAGIIAKIYPEAKAALIAQGRPAATVEAMPTVQAATLYAIQTYSEFRDNAFKWNSLPYWQSYKGMIDAWSGFSTQKTTNPLATIFSLLMPAVQSARLASVRFERKLDALQCVEGLRLYAAGAGGELPASLDALVDSPAPIDCATGKPFEYKVVDKVATLFGPIVPGGPDHPTYAILYEIKIAK